MAKQKRNAPSAHEPRGGEQERRPDHEGRGLDTHGLGSHGLEDHGLEGARAVEDAFELGNQAAADLLTGGARGEAALDVVRDAALPLVERAILALQIEPRRADEVARFVDIVQRSQLGEERRALIVDHLQSDRAAAEGIRDAVQRWFGGDGEALREAVGATLDGVLAGLQDGEAGQGAWLLPDGGRVELAEDAVAGSLSVRAEALVRDLADRVAPEAGDLGARGAGEAVRGFCRDVQLALLWDEEEEEEQGAPGDYAAEESGA